MYDWYAILSEAFSTSAGRAKPCTLMARRTRRAPTARPRRPGPRRAGSAATATAPRTPIIRGRVARVVISSSTARIVSCCRTSRTTHEVALPITACITTTQATCATPVVLAGPPTTITTSSSSSSSSPTTRARIRRRRIIPTVIAAATATIVVVVVIAPGCTRCAAGRIVGDGCARGHDDVAEDGDEKDPKEDGKDAVQERGGAWRGAAEVGPLVFAGAGEHHAVFYAAGALEDVGVVRGGIAFADYIGRPWEEKKKKG